MIEAIDNALGLSDALIAEKKQSKLADYIPYGLLPEHLNTPHGDWQLVFHNTKKQMRMLSTGNQEGKTFSGGHEDAYHLTGLYPDWWEGTRFNKPTYGWVCGVDNEKVRDSLQELLLGDPDDDNAFGTGLIPRNCLDRNRCVNKPQVPGAFQRVYVKHITGRWSKLDFKAYKQGREAFMSKAVDFTHCDEEPPEDILSSITVRGVTIENSIVYITCTPEDGLTKVQMQFRNELRPHQAFLTSTWDDCPHLTPEKRDQILSNIPAHEREMRSKGIPIIGTGVVFPIPSEMITVDAFSIPDHWFHACGIDFGGWNHPTAMVWIAWDRDTDMVYVYDCYKAVQKELAIHAAVLNTKGKKDITVFYPHDGQKSGDRNTGVGIAQSYRDLGCNMFHTWFTNPPQDGIEEGRGGNAVDVGLISMYNRMAEGRFKVFSHLREWFKEKDTYHTKEGKVVRQNEDLMSATRYAEGMLRHSTPKVRTFMRPVAVDNSYDPIMTLLN